MKTDAIRAMAMPILIPLAGYPPKLAEKLHLGDVAQLLSAPLFVAAIIAGLELLARRAEGDWSNLGVPLPVPGAKAFAAADAMRSGRRYRPA